MRRGQIGSKRFLGFCLFFSSAHNQIIFFSGRIRDHVRLNNIVGSGRYNGNLLIGVPRESFFWIEFHIYYNNLGIGLMSSLMRRES